MRSIVLTAVTLATVSVMMAATGLTGVTAGAKKFSLNNAVGKNGIQFISDAPMEKISGTADGVTGSFTLDPTKLEATKGRIEVQVNTMKTAMTKRDEHMYSDSWLDAAKYPTIVYEVQSLKDVEVSSNGRQQVVNAMAVGTFTLHGVTKPYTAKITLTYVPESEDTKKRAGGDLIALKAWFNVGLKDHGIAGRGGMVGSKVGESIQITAELYANS